MAVFSDEKIQKMLRRERERRTIIDIKRGSVRICDELITFAPSNLFNNKLTVWIPEGYTDLSDESSLDLLYIWWTPQVIISNNNRTVQFTWTLKSHSPIDGGIDGLCTQYREKLNDLHPATIFYGSDEVQAADGRKIPYLVFKTREESDYFFNICYFMEFEQGALVGTFECEYAKWPHWMEPVRQVIQSINVEGEG